jgi:hypothetical protein
MFVFHNHYYFNLDTIKHWRHDAIKNKLYLTWPLDTIIISEPERIKKIINYFQSKEII